MNRIKVGVASLATVATLTGTVGYTPQISKHVVSANLSSHSLQQDLGKETLIYSQTFGPRDVDKTFLLPDFIVQNFESPYIQNVTRAEATKSLSLSATKTKGNQLLWNSLQAEVKISGSGKGADVVYHGPLRKLKNLDILKSENYSFSTGLTEVVRIEVWLPKKDRQKLSSKNVGWTIVIIPK
jgi:hypothetical protein